MPWELLVKVFVAGLAASVACGLGALPLLIKRVDPAKHTGLGYGFAGGLMFAASVYNLILPALSDDNANWTVPGEPSGEPAWTLPAVVPILLGILLGAGFLGLTDRMLAKQKWHSNYTDGWGGRTGLLIFIAMTIHSIPEGVAVGVGYASGAVHDTQLGFYIALAIAIHNIPEGLAVAIPLRSAGASIPKCFFAAFLTSLPQPIAALPAVALAWFFKPMMATMMGFAAGAMIFLIIIELLPDALGTEKPKAVAWAFTFGFCLMLLLQVAL